MNEQAGCECKKKKILSWVLRGIAAALLLMPGIGKLMGAKEAVEMFEQLGPGKPAMYLAGVMELAAVVLLLIPKTKLYGAVLAVLVMLGAIVSHITTLGFGGMFPLAVLVFAAAVGTLLIHRDELPFMKKA